uniref:RxLR effector candidate protein n=1 Tax=Hyaloperonospora arabidopsidis (strain Emoy2) TaxID=559515 RepID=M4BG45_HYAAE
MSAGCGNVSWLTPVAYETGEAVGGQETAILVESRSASSCDHSQFAPSGNNGQATKTSKEPGDRPPYPGWEVPYRGAQIKGEAFLPLRALREAAQRANRKGSNNPGTPR